MRLCLLALSTATVLLLYWLGVSLALSPEQGQAVISKLAYQSRISHRLVDRIHSDKNWTKDPDFRRVLKHMPPAQFELFQERRSLSHDLALCKATESFGIQTEIAASRQSCASVRAEIEDIESWNRDKVINDADQMELEALKLY